ncbi:hypothetical protein BDR05DRAFT_278580 [Suillus weaverae]|nr:hypothetical protein BDR05DRAFT_278580 [Suillus weaverae]
MSRQAVASHSSVLISYHQIGTCCSHPPASLHLANHVFTHHEHMACLAVAQGGASTLDCAPNFGSVRESPRSSLFDAELRFQQDTRYQRLNVISVTSSKNLNKYCGRSALLQIILDVLTGLHPVLLLSCHSHGKVP